VNLTPENLNQSQGMSTQLRTAGTWFLTRGASWRSLGGIPGYLLTVADGSARATTIVGPEGLRRSVAAWGAGGFLNRSFFALRLREVDSPPSRQAVGGVGGGAANTASVGGKTSASASSAASGGTSTPGEGNNTLAGYACFDETGEQAGLEWWNGHVTIDRNVSDLTPKRAPKSESEGGDLSVLPILSHPFAEGPPPVHVPVAGGQGRPQTSPTPWGTDTAMRLNARAMEALHDTLRRPGLADLSTKANRQASLSYICRTPDRRGKFDVAKVRKPPFTYLLFPSLAKKHLGFPPSPLSFLVCSLTPPKKNKKKNKTSSRQQQQQQQQQQAKALGLPPGKLYGQLSQGKPVTAPGGRVVQPEEVLSDVQRGVMFMVVDCPTPAHFGEFVSSSAVEDVLASGDQVVYVFHMSPRDVIETPAYSSWMDSLSATGTKHIAMCEGLGSDNVVFAGSQNLTEHLSQAAQDAGVFFVPRGGNFETKKKGEEGHGGGDNSPSVINARHGMVFHCTPRVSEDFSRADSHDERVNPDMLRAAVRDAQTPFLSAFPRGEPAEDSPDKANPHHPCLSFFGTGSAIPSKYRNVTSMLLHSQACGDADSSAGWAVMVDCGEGTFGQMCRRFGRAEAERILADELRCVVFSHMHADHQLGLVRILVERQDALERLRPGQTQEPLVICGPKDLGQWLARYDKSCEPLRYSFIWNRSAASVFDDDECLMFRLGSLTPSRFPGTYSPLQQQKKGQFPSPRRTFPVRSHPRCPSLVWSQFKRCPPFTCATRGRFP
jgi:ribonuclease BN (tRNA processing enzyme)